MNSRILGLLAFALIGASGSTASMANDSGDPIYDVYLFWSPILTGTLDGQPFQGQLTAEVTFTDGITHGILFSIGGLRNGTGEPVLGIGGLGPVANQPEKWCSPAGCITKVPDGLDVQLSRSISDGFLFESLDITSTGTSVFYDSVAGDGNSNPPASLSASGGPGSWEVFVNVPEPPPLALWGAALLVFVLLERSRIVSKGRD